MSATQLVPGAASEPALDEKIPVLNATMEPPSLCFIRVPDGGLCTAFFFADIRKAVVFPGLSGIWAGIELARANASTIALIDAETMRGLVSHAHDLYRELAALADDPAITRPSADPSKLQ